jgi:hypothetical protein
MAAISPNHATDKFYLLQLGENRFHSAKLVSHLADLRQLPVVDSILRDGGVLWSDSAHRPGIVGPTPHPTASQTAVRASVSYSDHLVKIVD